MIVIWRCQTTHPLVRWVASHHILLPKYRRLRPTPWFIVGVISRSRLATFQLLFSRVASHHVVVIGVISRSRLATFELLFSRVASHHVFIIGIKGRGFCSSDGNKRSIHRIATDIPPSLKGRVPPRFVFRSN